MKARVIVNRQIVQKNRREGTDNPPISVKTYGAPSGFTRSGSPAPP